MSSLSKVLWNVGIAIGFVALLCFVFFGIFYPRRPVVMYPLKDTFVRHINGPSSSGSSLPPFKDAFAHLDWNRMKAERERDGMYSGQSLEEYLQALAPYLQPKLGPPRVTTRPEPLKVDCSAYPSVLTGKQRPSPVKVYDLTVVGYEMDLLEARLYELDDAVDLFVILEGTRAHRGYRKPLFFAQNLQRFERFSHKIMYLVADDADLWSARQQRDLPDGKMNGNDVPQKWFIEAYQRKQLYQRFIKAHGNISYDDLVIHGDLDEIPDGAVIHQMKHCETKLPAGFCPQGYTNHMRFPHKTRNRQGCFQPSVQSRKDIEGNKGVVLFNYVPSGGHVDAGMHASITGSLALQLYKYLSVAEGGIGPDKPFEFMKDPLGMPLNMSADGRRICCPQEGPQNAVHDDAQLAKYWKPWFMEANPERFPEFLSHDLMLWKFEVGKRLRG